jgi:hypothetical protein
MDFHGRSENYLVMYYSLNWCLICCPQCTDISNISCDVYSVCFKKHCPCENTSDGYFLRYGRKYCDRFLASEG